MNNSNYSRQIPVEGIRNVGIFNDCCDNDLTDLILDHTEPQPCRYTENQLAFPQEVLSYGCERYPAALKAVCKRSDKTFQINLLSYLSPEKEYLDLIADGIILQTTPADCIQSTIDTLTRCCQRFSRPIPCMVFCDFKYAGERSASKNWLPEFIRTAKESDCPILPLQLPIIGEKGFCGHVDLLTLKAYMIEGLYGEEITEIPVPTDLSAQAKEAHLTILENLADCEPEIEKAYCSNMTADLQILKQALRKKTISGKIIPVLCGIAAHYQTVTCSFGKSYDWPNKKGSQALLDAIIDYFPSPAEAHAQTIKGVNPLTGAQETRHCSPDEPFTALVFASTHEIKVLSGVAIPGMTVYNSLTGEKTQLEEMQQNKICGKDETKAIFCGDTAQLQSSRTTYFAVLSDAKHPFLFKSDSIAVFAIASPAGIKKEFFENAPAVSYFRNTLNGKDYLVSSDFAELQELRSRIEKAAGAAPVSKQIKFGTPEVFYRETISNSVDFDSRLKGSAGSDSGIAVVLRLTPLDNGGIVIKNLISDNTVPEKSITQVQTGIWEAAANGVLAGYPMEDILIEIIEIVFTSAAPGSQNFRNAGFNAMREAVKQAAPVLLAPWNRVRIAAAESVIGEVAGFITERCCMCLSMKSLPSDMLLTAQIPARELLCDFESALRNVSRAKAALRSILPGGFERVSKAEEAEIIKRTLGTI